jgi:hypothetical protein
LADVLVSVLTGAFVTALAALGAAAFVAFGIGAAFAGAGPAFFVGVTAFTAAARVEVSAATLGFLDDSPTVLVAALLAALEAFTFTTAPFFLSAATTVVGTVGPS